MPPLNEGNQRGCRPWVLLGRREHGQREPTARSKDTTCFAKSCARVNHQHESRSAERYIDAVIVEVHPLCIEDAVFEVAQTARLAQVTGDLDHLRGEVGCHYPTLRADTLSREAAEPARAPSEIEDDLPGLRIASVE